MFEKYIPIAGNSELYKINRALTNKEIFEMIPLENLAMTSLTDENKDILIQITQHDINPAVIMTATKKEEVIKKITERLENMDQTTRDTYLILFAHWFNNKVGEGMENEGNAYCDIIDIHLKYRGLAGKNGSTITKEQYEAYVQAIDILANTRVKIDITKETNVVYDKIKSLGWSAIEGFLISDAKWVYDKEDKVIGIWYNAGLIGSAYTKYMPKLNNKYPTALLNMDSKNYITAKNIGNYLCYLHQLSKDNDEEQTKLGLYSLMAEARYEIKPPNIQRGINRFLNHLKKAEEILIKNRIISKIFIPEGIHSKNYKIIQIEVLWN